jgi:YidC/Oxa1 family membrane protein insertase
MEQHRVLLAIALSFLVFFIWSIFFVKEPTRMAPEAHQEIQAEQEKPHEIENETVDTSEKQPAPAIEEAPINPNTESGSFRIINVETPLYDVKISEKEAALTSFLLKKYREGVEKNSPLKELISDKNKKGNAIIGFVNNTIPDLSSAVFRADTQKETLEVTQPDTVIAFRWNSAQGIQIVKKFHFSPDSYLVKMSVTVKNGSVNDFNGQLFTEIFGSVPEGRQTYGFQGPSGLIDGKLEQVKIKKLEEKSGYSGNVQWVSVESRYFMQTLIPDPVLEGTMQLATQGEMIVNRLVQPPINIPAEKEKRFEYNLFFGPKNWDLLKKIGYHLDKAIHFGMFDFIAKPCLWFMNQIHGIIPNYGFAIIILTVITKLILWPLGTKSYKSMNEMKRLQPLMSEIREKYKDDKKQMNQEMMALYKTYKINPMGGCLPMILQIPVFFALYRMLYQAIELRHAPFLLWINDLSAPDRLLRFDFAIPFMQPPYGIPVLTIIMGITMLLQQKMSPPPGDPTQAKMMMIMPLVFTFIFINFSSGLVLYWLTNNILSISQQYYIQKKYA